MLLVIFMKSKIILSVLAAAIFAASGVPAMAQDTKDAEEKSEEKTLTEENGKAVGRSLSGLYSQYQKTGSVEITNPSNIINLGSLGKNLANFKGTKDKGPFVKGLIASSKGMVTDENVNKVLDCLGAISTLDLSSIAGGAAGGLLSKLGGKSKSGSDNNDASGAASILNGFFEGLK